ncbi:MAG: hypothetical protein HYY06_30650 [Deltaproteobacteria bacterium]|nr:hypothetical protein [Deltaproteobacteria bacterium]
MRARCLLSGAGCFVVLIGGVAGCQQSFDDGLFVICQSPIEARAEVDPAGDPAANAAAASRWIASQVDNQEARAFSASLAPLPPDEKAAHVREAATRIGLDRCPVADVWEPADINSATGTPRGRQARQLAVVDP